MNSGQTALSRVPLQSSPAKHSYRQVLNACEGAPFIYTGRCAIGLSAASHKPQMNSGAQFRILQLPAGVLRHTKRDDCGCNPKVAWNSEACGPALYPLQLWSAGDLPQGKGMFAPLHQGRLQLPLGFLGCAPAV